MHVHYPANSLAKVCELRRPAHQGHMGVCRFVTVIGAGAGAVGGGAVVSNDTTPALSLGDVAVMTTLPASNPAAVISGAGPTTKSLHQMWDNPLGTRAFSSHVENK